MVLILGFVLGLFLCYRLAISETLSLREQYGKLERQRTLFENTPKQLSVLGQKQRYYDSILNSYQIRGSSLQNGLLRTINAFAEQNGILVVEFSEPHTIRQGDLTVNTYGFTLRGDYNAIIKLVHRLERESRFGEVINLDFQKKKNFRTGRHYLEARVLLKSFG